MDNSTLVPPTTNPPESFVTTILLVLILVASVVLNVIVVVVFARVRYAKDSSNLLLLNMAAADLVASGLWLVPAVVTSAAWTWPLGNGFCQFTGFVTNWCYNVNMHTFLAVSIEKFMRFWRPSKHKEVFYKTVVLVLIFGIWVFDLVLALFPLMGWGTRAFSLPQFGCALWYMASRSNLWFTWFISFLLPLAAGLGFYGLILHRVRKIRSRVTPGKPLVLEETAGGREGYIIQFKKAQRRFQLFQVSRAGDDVVLQPQNPPFDDEDDPGYGGSESDSDREEATTQTGNGNSPNTKQQDYKRKVKSSGSSIGGPFVLKAFDYKLTVTVFIAWMAHLLCWFPHMFVAFYWSYNFRPGPADGGVIFVTLVAFLSLLVKPIVYVTNRGLRKSIKIALCKKDTAVEVATMRITEQEAARKAATVNQSAV